MGALGVVPDQPVDQFLVEAGYIVSQERSIEHDEVLGDRSIEPFDKRILFRASRVGVEVCETENGAGRLEVLGKLAPIVGLKFADRERADLNGFAEEVGGACRGVVRIRTSKRKLSLDIDGGQDVPLHSVDEANNGIKLHTALLLSAELDVPYLLPFVMCARASIE